MSNQNEKETAERKETSLPDLPLSEEQADEAKAGAGAGAGECRFTEFTVKKTS